MHDFHANQLLDIYSSRDGPVATKEKHSSIIWQHFSWVQEFYIVFRLRPGSDELYTTDSMDTEAIPIEKTRDRNTVMAIKINFILLIMHRILG